MEIKFEQMTERHRKGVMEIYNYYIENSLAAYPEKVYPDNYYDRFIDITRDYPAYVLMDGSKIAGFCFLHAYHSASSFNHCALITYFLAEEYTSKGLGTMALRKLEEDASVHGISILLASISSENTRSIQFHGKHGFYKCGEFNNVIRKSGREFNIVWMQKEITQ